MNDDNNANIYNLDALDEGSDNEHITLNELQKLNKKDKSELTPKELLSRNKHNSSLADALLNISKLSFPDVSELSNSQPNLPDISNLPLVENATEKQQAETNKLLRKILDSQQIVHDSDIKIAVQPKFDVKTYTLYFANLPIVLNENTDAGRLCRRLFRGNKPVKHPVDKIDIAEALFITELEPSRRRKRIYTAKDYLNTLVAKQTTITDLFVVVDKKIWFNEKYL